MQNTRLYLYLARRDRRGIRVVAVLNGPAITSRVPDVSRLGLDHKSATAVENVARDSHMMWELWIEPASSYKDLTDRLRRRGYTHLPLASTPEVDIVSGFTAQTSRLPSRRVMTRKGARSDDGRSS